MVLLVGVALVHPDGGQGFQDGGAEVKQGCGAVVGCILQGQKGPQRDGHPECRQGLLGSPGTAQVRPHIPPALSRQLLPPGCVTSSLLSLFWGPEEGLRWRWDAASP